jgi:hypothetical protein
MNSLTTVAFHNENPIYAHNLKTYRRDVKHFHKNKHRMRRNLIKGHLASILNRMTLANSSTSILALIGAELLASHGVYV